jgi:hypothetical protein
MLAKPGEGRRSCRVAATRRAHLPERRQRVEGFEWRVSESANRDSDACPRPTTNAQ